jgi:hypothetical protein
VSRLTVFNFVSTMGMAAKRSLTDKWLFAGEDSSSGFVESEMMVAPRKALLALELLA